MAVDLPRLLAFISAFSEEHGYAPSVRDIRAGLGLSSPSVVTYWIVVAERQGLVKTDRMVARSIRLVEKEVESER